MLGVLSFSPRDDAALHVLGTVVYQKGDRSRAIDLYRQAISLNGRAAAYHGNLGNAYLETARPAEAARAFRRSLALEPGSALAHFGLGAALIAEKAYAAAAKELQVAAKALPNHADTHLNLAIALAELGHIDEAVAHCRRAVALNPGHPFPHLRLGLVLRAKGEPAAAQRSIVRAIELADAHYQRAITASGLQRPQGDAMPAPCEQTFTPEPPVVETLKQVGGLLYDLEQFDDAIGCYERGLALAPGNPALHHAIGRTRHLQGQFEEARAAFARALELQPDNAANYTKIGRTYEAEGRFEEAIAWQEKALARQPDNAEAHYSLAMMRSAGTREARVEQLAQILARGGLDTDRRASANFALAKLCDEGGDYDLAFRYVKEANDLRKAGHRYLADERSAFVDRLITSFGKQLFEPKENIGSRSERPVFIVGMPRSGTTLVEQILASHPQAHGHGELEQMNELARGLGERLGHRQAYPECVAGLDEVTAERVAEEHLDQLDRDGGRAARSIDKMPHNFNHLGLIALLFPRARLIHCLRDPRDTCLSCYFQDFGPRQPFTCDFDHLARYYRDYQRLMAHWHAVLPIPILDVPYEALVGDQEGWSRKLIDFVGLDWDDRCLVFHQTERPVFTSSAWQVRQPLYNSSIGRWRHYEKHLEPLFQALGVDAPEPEQAVPVVP